MEKPCERLMDMYWLILCLIVISAIEVTIFMMVGDAIGLLSVFMVIILSGMLGVVLVRTEGLKTWQRLKTSIQQGIHPSEEILDGICIIIAGIFLVTPGFFTDLLGLLLIIPFTRRPFKGLLLKVIRRIINNGNYINRRW